MSSILYRFMLVVIVVAFFVALTSGNPEISVEDQALLSRIAAMVVFVGFNLPLLYGMVIGDTGLVQTVNFGYSYTKLLLLSALVLLLTGAVYHLVISVVVFYIAMPKLVNNWNQRHIPLEGK